MPIERKLAAIMFTDIAGYTEQMSKDEAVAISLLETKKKVFRPLLKKYNGKLVKEMGDGTLSHFPSSIDAANCSIELQKSLKKNTNLNVRVGVHHGEVLFKNKDVYGDVVNIASRLETMSPAGGVLVSKNVYDELSNRKGYDGISLGLQSLKGIGRLVEVFGLKGDMLNEPRLENYTDTKIEAHKDDDIPSIAIVPFYNKGKAEDGFYAYGISADFIRDCSAADSIRVVSLKQIEELGDLSVEEKVKKLNVRYVATGTLWKMDDLFQLSIELYDSKKSKLVWSDRWQEHWDNLPTIKANLTDGLLKTFDKKSQPLKYVETTNSQAYENYLQGKYCSDFLKSKNDLHNGKVFLKKALELDDNFVEAYYLYGIVCKRLGNYYEAESALLRGQVIAETKNNLQGLAYIYKGFSGLYSDRGKWEKSKYYIENALKIQLQLNNPTLEVMLRLDYSNILNNLKEIESSIEQNKKSITMLQNLKNERLLGISYFNLTNTYCIKGDYTQSIQNGEKTLDIYRNLEMTNYLGRALVMMGEIYCRTGNYASLKKKINEAEPIVRDFKDTFLLAKINYLKAHCYLNKKDFTSALSHYDQSIEQFNLAEHTRFETKSLIEKLSLLIESRKLKDINPITSKIEHLMNKLKGAYSNDIFTAIQYYIDAQNEKLIIDNLNNYYQSLEDIQDNLSLNVPITYWYCAKAYKNIGHLNTAAKCHEKAKKILGLLAKRISGEKDKKTFYKVYFHKRICENLS